MVLEAHAALTPKGNPRILSMPVAPVVVCVILTTVLKHTVGEEDAALVVLLGVTVMIPVAFTSPHPPVSGII